MIPLEKVLKVQPVYKGSFVAGSWRLPEKKSGGWEPRSPANFDWALPTVSYDFGQVETAVGAGREAFKTWKRLPLSDRAAHVTRFGEELAKRSDLMARYMSIETGKTFEESQGEASLLQNKIKVTLEDGLALVQNRSLEIQGQGLCEMHYRPLGLVVVIGPFNFPVHLSHGWIVPHLLSGNTVILKPSEKSPYSAQVYMEAAEAAGFPTGVIQLIQGNAEIAGRLVRHPDVTGIAATCSLDVGVKILKDCAERPEKLVAVEMGGKNASLVWKGANVEETARALIRSAYLTTGQRCTALSRVYVERSLIDPLQERFHALAKELIINQPFEEDPKPFMGPLISPESMEQFLRYSVLAEGEKAEAVMRPKKLEGIARQNRKPLPSGCYVSPSIHRVATWNSKSAYQTHELFGPDLFFCPVDSVEEGIAATNSSRYGLVSSLFGGDRTLFDKFANEVECGLVYWNRPTVGASARLPFGGWKASGNHRPAGVFAMLQANQVQSRIIG